MFEAFNAEQIERLVKPMMRGERHVCYAITEADAGSDPDAIRTTARRDGDHYVVSGEKWHVTSANLADTIIVQAKLHGGATDRSACAAVRAQTRPASRTVRTPAYTHTFHHHHPVIAFENVRVPAPTASAREGDGMGFTRAWFRRERLMIAARCCGAAERLIEEATAFARGRMVGGEPIASYQLIQAMLADSATELQAARLITYEAAAAHDRGRRSQDAACPLLDGQALRLGNGLAGGRPGGADLRRPRLHARKCRRAVPARTARRPHLGRHQRDPAPHHRRRAS